MAERSPARASPPLLLLLMLRRQLPGGSASSPLRPPQEKRHHLSHVGGAGALCACAPPRPLRRLSGGTAPLPLGVTPANPLASQLARSGICLLAVCLCSLSTHGAGCPQHFLPICTQRKSRVPERDLTSPPSAGTCPERGGRERHRIRLVSEKRKHSSAFKAIALSPPPPRPELSLGIETEHFQDVSCLRFIRDVRNMPPRREVGPRGCRGAQGPTGLSGGARQPSSGAGISSPGLSSHNSRRPGVCPQMSRQRRREEVGLGCPALPDPAGCRVLLVDMGSLFHAASAGDGGQQLGVILLASARWSGHNAVAVRALHRAAISK
ncbi:uncharacterized protein [Heliangelus exortis]|uniref:uncharacterized protein n=1 Tax=Heliangelus exortis TaxID=472823 RepID=UPI003A90F994